MNKRILCIILSLSLMLASCSGAGEIPYGQSKTDETRNQLLMIYMVGSDLESEAGMASRDIKEIMESDFCQENMEVLICTGGAGYWWMEGISSERCEVYRVAENSLERIYTMKNTNMADANTLTEFIDCGYSNYKADYYSLVMWNHGGGAVLGFGADENYGYDTLSLEEMKSAFKATQFVTDGKRFEWVGFDACLMSMIEVAYILSDYADYLLASEEMEVGEGWDYSCLKIISDGEHSAGPQAAEEIIRAYSAYYETNYEHVPDYTLACLDLSQAEKVVSGLERLVDVAGEELRGGGYSKIAKLRDATKAFGRVSSYSFYDTVDLYDFSERMMPLYPEQASVLQTALEDMVLCAETNVHGAYGLSVYFPYENKEYREIWMAEYESFGFSSEYVSFLKSFTGILSGEQLAEWNLSETAPVESAESPGEYYVQLTEEQYANYSHAKYSIWEEDSLGSYICWIHSSDVTVSKDGKISSGFLGKRYFLGDTSGVSLPCCVIEMERNESYIKYAIPILIIPGGEDAGFSMERAYIHIRVDETHPEGGIVGVYRSLNTDNTLLPDRDVVEIVEGDIISPFYFAREIVFEEDGSVGPFEKWESTSGIGSSFEVTGDFRVTLKNVKEEKEYCCLFDVTDTQGNSYYTNPVYIRY